MNVFVQFDTALIMYFNSLALSSELLMISTRVAGTYFIFIIILFGVFNIMYTVPGLNISGPFLFIQMLLAGTMSWVVNNLIGAVWFRERPFVQYPDAIHPLIDIQHILKSFPSDHSALAMALAVIVTLYFPKIGIPFILLALLIGIARIAAGVHFPTDILAGFVIGSIVAIIVQKVFI